MKIERQLPVEIENRSGADAPSETLAWYFRGLANQGRSIPSNPAMIASKLGWNLATAIRAKRVLVTQGRLLSSWGRWISIDGLQFNVGARDGLEHLKTVLRRRHDLVCDARTVEMPGEVAEGEPTHLIVDGRRLTLAEAMILSEQETA